MPEDVSPADPEADLEALAGSNVALAAVMLAAELNTTVLQHNSEKGSTCLL
jgi:hypothetical protein